MAVKISGSVGQKARNKANDVKKVQKLLNDNKSAGGYSKLKVDGLIGAKTIGAISSFQKKVVGIRPDGRVDPGGKTISVLNGDGPSSGSDGDDGEDGQDLFSEDQLRQSIKKLARSPQVFAFGLAARPEDCVLVLRKKGSPKTLGQAIRKAKGLKKVAFGIASQDESSRDTMVLDLQCKPLPGLANKGKKFLTTKKLLPFKQIRLMAEGAEVEDLPEEEEEAPTSTPGTFKPKSRLSGSVGKGGKNAPDDVMTVQALLNKHGAKLAVDGKVGVKTVKAIAMFQKKTLGFFDGRVDPGGKTWGALTGQSVPTGAPPPGSTPGPGAGGGSIPSEVDDRPVPDESEPEEKPKKPRRKGIPPWWDAETEIPTVFGVVKIETDAHGNVKGGSITNSILDQESVSFGIPPYSIGMSIKPLDFEVTFKGTGPEFPVAGKVICGGAGFLMMGAERDGIIVGLKGEIGLSVSSQVFTGQVNLDKRTWSFKGTSFPIKIPLKGEIKAGAAFEVGDKGVNHMVPIKTYDKIVIATIDSNFNVTIKKGPGLDQMKQDLMDVRQFILDNPTAAGTGAQPLTEDEIEQFGEEPEEAESFKETIDETVKGVEEKAAKMEAIQTCRAVEAQMNAAYQAGWADPNLLGKANALAQQDKDLAKKLYGNAWTLRALAKQAYDQYSSPIESNPLSIIQARTAQANDIAQKFNNAVALFKQGDASW